MNKKLTMAISIVAATGLVGGLSATAVTAAPAKITIAAVYGNTFDPFWTSIGCGAAAEAKKLGVKLKQYTSTSDSAASFDASFNSAQLIQPNGLMVNPLNENQFVTQQKKLLSAGVPVVTINGSTPASQYRVVGTATNDVSADIKKLVPTGAGSVGIINGVPGLVPVDNRLNPVINAVLKTNTSLKKLEPAYSFFDSAKATSAVSAMIVANPDLKVIIAGTGPDGQGAAAAVKAAGLSGKITVIALDATPAEVAALKDGTITALVAQAPARIGAEQVKALVSYLRGTTSKKAITASSKKIGVPQKVLTKANVSLAANADWVYKASCK